MQLSYHPRPFFPSLKAEGASPLPQMDPWTDGIPPRLLNEGVYMTLSESTPIVGPEALPNHTPKVRCRARLGQ